MTLNELIQVAGILLGFQVTFFTFRMTRELSVNREERWFPLPDYINLISALITVLFIFIYPLKNIDTYDIKVCQKVFGFSVLLLVIYPFAMIGHYELYTNYAKRSKHPKYVTKQEIVVLILGGVISIYFWI